VFKYTHRSAIGNRARTARQSTNIPPA
jgi:hypothetical protein